MQKQVNRKIVIINQINEIKLAWKSTSSELAEQNTGKQPAKQFRQPIKQLAASGCGAKCAGGGSWANHSAAKERALWLWRRLFQSGGDEGW